MLSEVENGLVVVRHLLQVDPEALLDQFVLQALEDEEDEVL